MNRLSHLGQNLRGSEILRISGDIRALQASGQQIVNLTVGDFSPKEFPIPAELTDGIVEALRAGETNYPPSNGLDALRAAVQQFYEKRLDLHFPFESILVTSGARPAIYSLFRALVDPGEVVVYGAPSWNNDYYVDLVGAKGVAIECNAETNFLPSIDALRDAVKGARLLSLNSPLNPTGTMFEPEHLAAICDLVIEENERRGAGERPLYMMYDQVYWMLTVGDAAFSEPITLRPEISQYVVVVDAISKAFASTGLRVGWAAGPADIIKAMSDIVGHMGAWAPRPEQVATARLLCNHAAVDRFIENMRREVSDRLDAVYGELMTMRESGLPVNCARPQGAMYVSAQFALHGRTTPEGELLETDDQIRRYLLTSAGLGAVPFGAFGSRGGEGWFRLSIGVVSVQAIRELMPRVRQALEALR